MYVSLRDIASMAVIALFLTALLTWATILETLLS